MSLLWAILLLRRAFIDETTLKELGNLNVRSD
jgi:hypothetical protein